MATPEAHAPHRWRSATRHSAGHASARETRAQRHGTRALRRAAAAHARAALAANAHAAVQSETHRPCPRPPPRGRTPFSRSQPCSPPSSPPARAETDGRRSLAVGTIGRPAITPQRALRSASWRRRRPRSAPSWSASSPCAARWTRRVANAAEAHLPLHARCADAACPRRADLVQDHGAGPGAAGACASAGDADAAGGGATLLPPRRRRAGGAHRGRGSACRDTQPRGAGGGARAATKRRANPALAGAARPAP